MARAEDEKQRMQVSDGLVARVMEQIWESVDVAMDRADVTLDMTLGDDLGLKSMDAVAIAIDLERQFGIEIATAELVGIRTLRDVVRIVAAKSEARRRP